MICQHERDVTLPRSACRRVIPCVAEATTRLDVIATFANGGTQLIESGVFCRKHATEGAEMARVRGHAYRLIHEEA